MKFCWDLTRGTVTESTQLHFKVRHQRTLVDEKSTRRLMGQVDS
jgi:hypothetical protein